MSDTHRVDGEHRKNGSPQESVITTASLDRRRAVQTAGMDLRNAVYRLVRQGNPDQVAADFKLRGPGEYHDELIEAALDLERTMPGSDLMNGAVLRTLELLKQRLSSPPERPPVSVEAIAERVGRDQSMRADNSDILPHEWDQLEEQVPDALRRIVQLARQNTISLRHTLDTHEKFPMMQNSKAFERDLNASGKPGTFVFFDLINFKNYNSRYSYDFVDHIILQRLCEALRSALPAGSLASIKGGDEFMIFIPDGAEGAPADTREAAAMIARIVREGMEALTPEDVENGKKYLIGKKKGPIGYLTGALSRFTGGDPDGPDAQRKETERILADIRKLHGKISAVKRTPEMSCQAAVHRTETGLKNVSSWHYRSNMDFPSSVDEDGELSRPFSATGSEVRDFFIGAKNDFKDLLQRLTR